MIFVVTTNDGKWKEMRELLRSNGIEIARISASVPEIQSNDLEEVVRFSTAHALKEIGKAPLLLEDAGLFVDKLGGFPGPYTSYVYATIGCEGLLRLMEGIEDRSARFVSVVAFTDGSDRILTFRGECKGRIAERPIGTNGFGFDPVFVPDEGDGRTFAEMGVNEKNKVSHRSRSVKRFVEWYLGRSPSDV